MKIRTKVRNIETGKFGHVIQDSFGCCSNEEDLIVYDRTNTGLGTDRAILEEVTEEPPIPDMNRCGAGKGKECCIFLTMSPDGPVCERFTTMRDALIFKTMNAERNPKEPYPECMKF